MTRIALICPYFGKVPDHFPQWLISAKFNENITFIIVGDVEITAELPENVKFVRSSFSEIQRKIRTEFGENVIIDKPYKLADFRPAFGNLFAELFTGFEFWGYLDLDTILGDLKKYITEEKLDTFDKIGIRGHFTIYRNCEKINNLFLDPKPIKNTISFKTAFFKKGAFHFDEDWGMGSRMSKYDLKIDSLLSPIPVMADISPKHFRFNPLKRNIDNAVYIWDKGHLYESSFDNFENDKNEVMYVHFQKRKILSLLRPDSETFFIIPNEIRSITINSYQSIRSSSYPKSWPEGNFTHIFKYYLNVINSGELKARLYKWINQ